MQITAAQVKTLRERTGAGMMECKKALVENNGDLEVAVEAMRKSGAAKADKKSGRIAAEGLVDIAVSDGKGTAVIVEVNSETDFVAKADDFIAFVQEIGQCVLNNRPADVEALLGLSLANGSSVEDNRRELIAKIGENINVRRFHVVECAGNSLGAYKHGTRIAVLVNMQGGDEALAKDIAMHVAASRPVCVDESGVPAEVVEKEREIFSAQAAESGKPENIIEKMVEGRMKKFMKEVTLLGQPFVKDPDLTVQKLLADRGASVVSFERFEVGEGLEKRQENFAEEVKAQAGG